MLRLNFTRSSTRSLIITGLPHPRHGTVFPRICSPRTFLSLCIRSCTMAATRTSDSTLLLGYPTLEVQNQLMLASYWRGVEKSSWDQNIKTQSQASLIFRNSLSQTQRSTGKQYSRR
nr:hypothetical protein Iba_scaffold74801CG0010 [Ipomoea batatas]GME11789.1 hypothetical protein Iba_scaffold12417CG0010 [Ipomoea batatas]